MSNTTYYTMHGNIMGEQTDSNPSLNYVNDGIGSIVNVTDAAGEVSFTASYKPHGDFLAMTGTPPVFTFLGRLGYNSGLGGTYAEFYVRQRFLSSTTGQWISTDSLWPAEPAYIYVSNSPVTLTDPLGLCSATYFTRCRGTKLTIATKPQKGAITKQKDGTWSVNVSVEAKMQCDVTCYDCGPSSKNCVPFIQIPQWISSAYNINYTQPIYEDYYDGDEVCGMVTGGPCNWSRQGYDAPGWWGFGVTHASCNPIKTGVHFTWYPEAVAGHPKMMRVDLLDRFCTCCNAGDIDASIYLSVVGSDGFPYCPDACQSTQKWWAQISIIRSLAGDGSPEIDFCGGGLYP